MKIFAAFRTRKGVEMAKAWFVNFLDTEDDLSIISLAIDVKKQFSK